MTKAINNYKCDICKKAPKDGRYRRKWQWKTQKGYQNHKCWKDVKVEQEEYLNKLKEDIAKLDAERLIATEEFKKIAKYSIGQHVFYGNYEVTAPTHELRGERLVRVRYEEGRKYRVYSGVISDIRIGGYIVNNTFVLEASIYLDDGEASRSVAESQRIYDAYLRDCSNYR